MEEKVIEVKNEADDPSVKEVILELIEWYRYLLSKWITIVAFGLLGGILGFTYAKFKKPTYSAVTTFVLEESDKGGGLGQYAGIASMVGINLGSESGGGIFQGDNILELYKSRTMIEKTLLTEVNYNGKKQLLIDRYIDFNELRKKWAEKPELKNIQFQSINSGPTVPAFNRLQDSIIGTVVTDINKRYLDVAKPDKNLSIIKAEVKAKDEFFAKNFDEQIVKNVNDFYVQTKTKKSLQNVKIMQQKTDSVRSVMNGSIYSAAAVTDATPNLNNARQAQRMAPLERSQFSVETNKAILSELIKNLELGKIALTKDAPLIQVVDKPIYPLEMQKLSKLIALILGGFIAGFLTCVFLVIKRLFKRVLE